MREILVIDDDPELANLLGSYLKSRNFNVQLCNNGEQGLSLLQNKNIDMVILDVMMPDMDGFEVLRHIRRFSSTPVIMLTARGDEMDRIVGLEMGADDFVCFTGSVFLKHISCAGILTLHHRNFYFTMIAQFLAGTLKQILRAAGA